MPDLAPFLPGLVILLIAATASPGPAVAMLLGVAQADGRRDARIIALFVLCHVAWALLLSSGPIRRAYARDHRWIEAGLGTFFAFGAWKLATLRECGAQKCCGRGLCHLRALAKAPG